MQINEFKAEVVRKGMTLDDIATKTGMNRTTLWRRLNNPDGFTLKEIKHLKYALDLNGQRVLEIFFDPEVS
jgi:DNA-binding phage protein